MAVAEFFKTCNILLAYLRQLIKRLAAGDILVKSLEFLVNRLALSEFLKSGGIILDNSSVGKPVSSADLQSLKTAQCIELVDNEAVKTVYANSMAHDNGIEPACSSGTACNSAELVAVVSDVISVSIKKLCGERTLSDTCCISLGNAVYLVDDAGAYACADANACSERVRACNIGVSTEIDIEKSSLSALEEDSFSCLLSLICENGNISEILSKALTVSGVLLDSFLNVNRLAAVNLGDYLVFESACASCLFSEHLGMNEVIEADTAALILVHICRAYASAGSTDIRAASELFGESVELDMPGHDDMSSGVDPEVIEGYTSFGHAVYLAEQVLRVEDYACADKAEGIFIEYTRWDKVELIDFAVAFNGMACVISALRANNDISFGSKDIYDLAFSLVTPLGTDNNISGHCISSFHKYFSERDPDALPK